MNKIQKTSIEDNNIHDLRRQYKMLELDNARLQNEVKDLLEELDIYMEWQTSVVINNYIHIIFIDFEF